MPAGGRPNINHRQAASALRARALSFPGVFEDFPWGHSAMKVRARPTGPGKVFLFVNADKEGLSLSLKLGPSHAAALAKPFASPTAYGLGKSGWVTARFLAGQRPPTPLLEQWVEESYRAIAPRSLLKQLTPGPAAPAKATKPAPKPAAKPRPTTPKPRAVRPR